MLWVTQLIGSAAFGFAVTLAVAAPRAGQGTWEATLEARDIDGNPVALDSSTAAFFYDATLNVTWLANMNAAAGTTFDDGLSSTDGRMGRNNAVAWAASLTYFGGGWRLPATLPINGSFYQMLFVNNGTTDHGYAKTYDGNPITPDAWGMASEYGHLHYVTLGNRGYCTPTDSNPAGPCFAQAGAGLTNTAYFKNFGPNAYWSKDTVASGSSTLGWYFLFGSGGAGSGAQTADFFGSSFSAVAVRNGDVMPAVPELSSFGRMLAGLAALAAVSRLRNTARERQAQPTMSKSRGAA